MEEIAFVPPSAKKETCWRRRERVVIWTRVRGWMERRWYIAWKRARRGMLRARVWVMRIRIRRLWTVRIDAEGVLALAKGKEMGKERWWKTYQHDVSLSWP